MISTKEFSIDNTGSIDVTNKLQEIIDYAVEKNEMLRIENGTYLVSAIYLKSNLKLYFCEGSIIKGIADESIYPLIKTRVAGIDMPWYPAILNIINASNVHIYGKGEVLGAGEYWYQKYWGVDKKGGMRKVYDENRLRWACDYECKRVRNILISNSDNIIINGIKSRNSGFWNIHILYSNHIIINNASVYSESLNGPSTDGIDIDSSNNVLIDNCVTYCNDDNIVIKSGRDSDGIKRGIPSKNIIVRNCKINQGYGITIGSEVSGGIENIHIHDIEFNGSDCGFRIKSALARKGYIKRIEFNNIKMTNVKYPININLDWNPEYSKCEIPKDSKIQISTSLMPLLDNYNQSFSNTIVSDIYLHDINSNVASDYNSFSRAFTILGFNDVKIKNVRMSNINITAHEYGHINNVNDIKMDNVKISILSSNNPKHDSFDNR